MGKLRALSNLGSHVYGFGAIGLGIIGLVWGKFATTWQPIQTLGNVPQLEALAYLAAVCLLAGGLAIQWRRSARAGAVLLAILYFIFALFWLPRIIGFPRIFGTWGGFLEEFALVAAAAVVYASLAPRDSAWAARTEQVGRFSIGICELSFGTEHFTGLAQTISMVPHWIPPNQQFWAVATGIAHLLAGLAILTGVLALLASRLLTLMIGIFGALVWLPALVALPRSHMVWAGNALNLALMGAAWIVAGSFARRQKQDHLDPAGESHLAHPSGGGGMQTR